MMAFVLRNKTFVITILVLLFYIFITDIYRGELFENWDIPLDIHQIWRELYINMPNVSSFYKYSYNDHYFTNDGKIVIGFWEKPFFLVGRKQSNIMDIWLNFEQTYKIYYRGKNGELIYLQDVKYSKEMENKCTILK